MYTFFDLCSGIGGGRLGLELAGFKCIGHSDTSKLSNTTYNYFFDTKNDFFISNINKLDELNTPSFDLLIAGFPCQSFSVIGRKKGFDDKRGQIIFKIKDIISYSKPKAFILENVKGLVSHNGGNTFNTIINILQEAGYKIDHKILTTNDFGIPQNRQRVYIIGIRNDLATKKFEWPLLQAKSTNISDYLKCILELSENDYFYLTKYLSNETNNNKYSISDLLSMNNTIFDTRMNDLRIYIDKMPTLRSQRDGIIYSKNNKLYKLTGYEALLFQGFPEDKANIVRNIVSDRHLLIQAGNAMSVNVIKEIGITVKKYLEENDMSDNMTWKEFETNSTNILEKKYKGIASFFHEGESDSTKSDIKVVCNDGSTYYIEAKHCPAQCGQFVLLPKIATKTFEYSSKNINDLNDYAKVIINHMNNDFEAFKEAGTAGKDITFSNCEDVFSNWIISNYKKKNVRFIITNDYKIVRIDDFKKAFSITATYRIKRSGSSSVGSKNITAVHNELIKMNDITNIIKDNDKLYIKSNKNMHNKRFILNGYEYMISKRDDSYEIRKLSNTFNANVIFSVNSKPEYKGLSDDEFIREL